MGLIAALIVGGIAGWLAGIIMKGQGQGVMMNIIIGIIGGLVGGFLFSLLGMGSESSGMIGSISADARASWWSTSIRRRIQWSVKLLNR